jgi:hypothetical protein
MKLTFEFSNLFLFSQPHQRLETEFYRFFFRVKAGDFQRRLHQFIINYNIGTHSLVPQFRYTQGIENIYTSQEVKSGWATCHLAHSVSRSKPAMCVPEPFVLRCLGNERRPKHDNGTRSVNYIAMVS